MTQELYLGITNRNPGPNRRAQRPIRQKEAFPQMFLLFPGYSSLCQTDKAKQQRKRCFSSHNHSLAALAKEVSRTHTGQLTAAYNSSPRAPDASSGLPGHLHSTHACT